MQIAIVQAEIEDAIRTYILSQIHVNSAMDIKIKLLATRGDDGFRALIDIQAKETEGYQSPVIGGSNLGAGSVNGAVNSTPLIPATPTLRGTTPAERNRIMQEIHNVEDIADKVTEEVVVTAAPYITTTSMSGNRDATEGRRQLFAGIKRAVNTSASDSEETVSANIS